MISGNGVVKIEGFAVVFQFQDDQAFANQILF